MSPAPRRTEILAPAGDMETLRAAVAAGADAVYLGLTSWSARARATNFDRDALAEAMGHLHRHGRKGYIALNTLVFDAELAAVESAVRMCAEAGADAVIVQDLGVARLVRAVAPELPIHASTQMTCTDAASVELARELGASRVILARELSLDEIARIGAATDVELEVFVHGALCIAYSGQCLTSEAIGGRSANRGACAQACRLPYDLVVDGEVRERDDRAYLLSPQDLEASALVPRLVELGVRALKIEGRLKGPAYVAATTRLYRDAVDALAGGGAAPDDAARRAALQTYSRGSGLGFLAGVDHQRLVEGRACDHRGTAVGALRRVEAERGRTHLAVDVHASLGRGDGILVEGGHAGSCEVGGRVWAIEVAGREVERVERGEARIWLGPDRDVGGAVIGRRVWKTDDPVVERAALAIASAGPRRERVDVTLRGRIGAPPHLSGSLADGTTASVTGDGLVDRARGEATGAAIVREKLGRLGDTPFELGEVVVDLEAGALVPPAALNRLRRNLCDALLAARRRAHRTTDASAASELARALPPLGAPPAGGLFVLCRTLEQATAARDAGADGVWLDFLALEGLGAAVAALRRAGPGFVGVAPPRIRKPGEEATDRYLASLSPDGLLVRGLGALRESTGARDGVLRVGDFSLNVTNRLTAAELLRRGLAAFTPSFDLDALQLESLLATRLGPWAELVVHHPMPLFHMEHCVIAAELSSGRSYEDCGRPCDRHKLSLRDRAGMDHPIEADVGCRNTVFHAAAQSAAAIVPAARRAGVARFRIELVREDAAQVARVVGAYRDLFAERASPAQVWRAVGAEGHYGVVRGSLRVLS